MQFTLKYSLIYAVYPKIFLDLRWDVCLSYRAMFVNIKASKTVPFREGVHIRSAPAVQIVSRLARERYLRVAKPEGPLFQFSVSGDISPERTWELF